MWNSKYDWQFEIERTRNFERSLTEGPAWPRGKMLGGSSSINAEIYLRGFPYDYDHWEALGNTDWGYDSVRPIFERLEANMAANRSASDEMGPLKIDYTYSNDPVRGIVASAAAERGYAWATDFNNGDYLGYSSVLTTTHKGLRSSSATAYLVPAANRRNLWVLKKSRVTKVIMKGDKAVGVRYTRKGYNFKAYARKEVILSAGSVSDVPILMHSGIGPAKELRKFGIEVKKNLPVGRTLEDWTSC